jgi:mannitol-1-/sugar-/sorbitol-6-phosphatase
MLTMNCRAILFDLDGTLIDSDARIRRLWQEWSARHGIELESILRIMHGRRAAETIRMVAPHLPVDEEVCWLEADELADMEGVSGYPGAAGLLRGLAPGQWAVVTSGARPVAEARMRYVQLPVPGVFITSGDVRIGKPDPEGYCLAAARLGVSPGDCVVIEDAPAGIRAGKAAGMRVVAVASTHAPPVLTEANAVIPGLAMLEVQNTGREIRVLWKDR